MSSCLNSPSLSLPRESPSDQTVLQISSKRRSVDVARKRTDKYSELVVQLFHFQKLHFSSRHGYYIKYNKTNLVHCDIQAVKAHVLEFNTTQQSRMSSTRISISTLSISHWTYRADMEEEEEGEGGVFGRNLLGSRFRRLSPVHGPLPDSSRHAAVTTYSYQRREEVM